MCSRAMPNWKKVKVVKGQTYHWDIGSTYVKNPPYFDGMKMRARAVCRYQGRAHPGAVRRFHHHRSHLARRLDQDRLRPAGNYLQEHQASQHAISIPMARGAAITK